MNRVPTTQIEQDRVKFLMEAKKWRNNTGDKNPKEKVWHEIERIIISCGFPKQKDFLWKSPISKGKFSSIVLDPCFPEKFQKLFLTNIVLLSPFIGTWTSLDFFLSQETDPHLGKSNPSHSITPLGHLYIQCPQVTEELLCLKFLMWLVRGRCHHCVRTGQRLKLYQATGVSDRFSKSAMS